MSRKFIINDEKFMMELLIAWNKLAALEYGGVDNWECYGWSVSDFLEEAEVEDFEAAAEKDLKHLLAENKIFEIN